MPKINSSFFNNFSSEDDEDEVVKTKTPEVEEEVEKEEKEDDDLITSKSGDDSGDKTKESDEVDPEDEDRNFFATIIEEQAAKGLLFYDEDKEYTGTGEEIFDEVITDTLEKRFNEEYVDPIPEEYRSILTHLKLGKPLEDWVEAVKPTDYSKVDLEDEGNQKSLIEEHLALTGMDEDDIKDKVKEYEDAGTLEKNSKTALKYLKKFEDTKAANYEKELERETKEQEELNEKELLKFKTEVLSTEELGAFKLKDKKEREKLFEHITKPVNKKGESQLVINQKDRQKQLLFAYLDMKGFDFKQLETQVESKVTKGLRAKLSNTTDVNAQRRGESGRVNTPSKRLPSGPWSGSVDDDE